MKKKMSFLLLAHLICGLIFVVGILAFLPYSIMLWGIVDNSRLIDGHWYIVGYWGLLKYPYTQEFLVGKLIAFGAPITGLGLLFYIKTSKKISQ
ncbi:MAG: hypothetical protein HGA61_02055 [Candidatus Moranbacteria bacterium]|nr:hypothetical protein [Candidatus Moranbacteria bacterium]